MYGADMDASHRNRRKHRRTIKRNKSRNQRKMNLIIIAAAIVVMAVMALVARDFYFFITGNDVTEETPYPVKGVDVSFFQFVFYLVGNTEYTYSSFYITMLCDDFQTLFDIRALRTCLVIK